MTTEEALNTLTYYGFVHEGWRTPDEVGRRDELRLAPGDDNNNFGIA